MQKQGLSPGRLAVIVLFTLSVFGLLLFLWLSFGGPIPLKPQGYEIKVSVPEAAQLAQQADVRVAGVSIGKVVKKERDPKGNRTLATLSIDRKYAPLHADARAILRQKTLLGETYIELTTGTKRAPIIKEGGQLSDFNVQPTVELDELLQIFDQPTRNAFRLWQRELATAGAGRAQDLNDALGNFPGFTGSGTSLLSVLNTRSAALSSQIRNTGVTFRALSANEGRLQTLIVATRQLFDAIARQRNDLADTIRIFPTFLDESKSTLARLRTFARKTDPLLVDLQPTLRDLRPTLVSVNRLSPDLQHLFQSLNPLVDASATGLPAMQRVLEGLTPTLAALGPFLEQLNPILQWLQLYQSTVSDFLSVGPGALANREPTPNPQGLGHVLPQLIVVGDQTLLTKRRTRSNRGNTYFGPDVLESPQIGHKEILPNWDCHNAGGEHGPGATNMGGFGGDPGCFVQGPIPFQGKSDFFPHVTSENYSPKHGG